MGGIRRRKFRWGGITLAGVLVAGLAGYAAPAGAALLPAAHVSQQGPVSSIPAAGTPALVYNEPTQRIRQLVQCGGTMYAVGQFTEVTWNGTIYPRDNAFSFRATAPFTITSWNPDVDGRVDSVAFDGSNCLEAYLGGAFTSVNSAPAHNLAAVSTVTGTLTPGFGDSTNGEVETLAVAAGHLLAGGYFTWINGSGADPYMASVSPSTGKNDGFLHLDITGYIHYCGNGQCTQGSRTYVYNQQVSHGGTLELAEGDFTSVGGLPRQQIFMLNLAADPATVTAWTSPQWDGSKGNVPGGYPYQCYFNEGFYLRAAAWSPSDSTVYIASTGYHPWNLPTGTYPRSGLCDSTSAFPATQGQVLDKWIAYTGCYSLYSVAADDSAVYVAGHPKYIYDPDGCKIAGAGAIRDVGMLGLSAASGSPLLKTTNLPMYTMSRANADDMLLTSAGLWVASSNRYGSQHCGPRSGHSGICFLPYPAS
jgi:hypothetical protein